MDGTFDMGNKHWEASLHECRCRCERAIGEARLNQFCFGPFSFYASGLGWALQVLNVPGLGALPSATSSAGVGFCDGCFSLSYFFTALATPSHGSSRLYLFIVAAPAESGTLRTGGGGLGLMIP